MIRRIVAAAGIALGMAAAAPAEAEWLEATSRHFILYGNASESTLRKKAEALERLDWGLRRFMKVDEEPDIHARKLRVFLVDDRDIARLCRCSNVAGFYKSNISGSMAFSGTGQAMGDLDFGRITLFHEYAHHFLLGTFATAFPTWFSEGFAEFAGTAKVEPLQIVIGSPANHRAAGLFEGPRLPVAEMMDPATHGKLKSVEQINAFYGRGWLMTHYLMFEPGRFEQFSAYLKAINTGAPMLRAAGEAFGDLTAMERAVNAYLRRSKITAAFLKYGATPVPTVSFRKLSAGEAALIDRRMESIRGVGEEEADKLFARAAPIAAKYPDDPIVQGWLAEMAHDAGDDAAAEAAANRAIARDPKSIQALTYLARTNLRRLAGAKDPAAADWAKARMPVITANRADPDHPAPLWLYWLSFQLEGRAPPASAYTGLYRAQELMPQDDEVRFTAAMARLHNKEREAAASLLRPLAYDPHQGTDNPAARMLVALDAGKSIEEVMAAGKRASDESQETGTAK